MEGRPLDPRTIQWMRWAYLQAWLSPLGYQYEVRHDDATIGPVSFDQMIRAHTEHKIPAGAEARIVGDWTSVADLVAGRSMNLGDYESTRSFFEEADGSKQLTQRIVSALAQLGHVDGALRKKIETDAEKRGWERHVTNMETLPTSLRDFFGGVVAGGTHSGTTLGEHQFHCLRRGALALVLRFDRPDRSTATLMLYAYRFSGGFVIVSSNPV